MITALKYLPLFAGLVPYSAMQILDIIKVEEIIKNGIGAGLAIIMFFVWINWVKAQREADRIRADSDNKFREEMISKLVDALRENSEVSARLVDGTHALMDVVKVAVLDLQRK